MTGQHKHCRSAREAADLLGMSVHVFNHAMRRKDGPKRVEHEGHFVFCHADLKLWKARHDMQRVTNDVLGVREAAEYLNLKPSYLARLRSQGRGPVFSRRGKYIVYTRADLNKWNALRKRHAARRAQSMVARAHKLLAAAESLKTQNAL